MDRRRVEVRQAGVRCLRTSPFTGLWHHLQIVERSGWGSRALVGLKGWLKIAVSHFFADRTDNLKFWLAFLTIY